MSRLNCDQCGIVDPVKKIGLHVCFECGVDNITVPNATNLRCPHCNGWLGWEVFMMTDLHAVIRLALLRKRKRTEKEETFLRKTADLGAPQKWTYRRRGLLIECIAPEGRE